MDRAARLLSLSNRQSLIVEVGAGYNPVAPKRGGWRTHVVDHADQAALREKYAGADVDVSLIEEVDTIWRDGLLDHAVASEWLGRFDTMIASHVLEHMPDMIAFLRSAERLLRPDGVIALALPDRRYCFDCLKPPTTTGDVLEAHAAGRVRHGIRPVWAQLAYSAGINGGLAWNGGAVGPLQFHATLDTALAVVSDLRDDPAEPYVDFHCWYLTPAGFALIMLELSQIGMVDWRVESISRTEGFEFFVFLRRGGIRITDPASLQERRMQLIRDQLLEQRELIDMVCGGANNARSVAMEPEAPPSPAGSAALSAKLDRLLDMLGEQDTRLREIERSALTVRTAMGPFRKVWRSLRRVAGRR